MCLVCKPAAPPPPPAAPAAPPAPPAAAAAQQRQQQQQQQQQPAPPPQRQQRTQSLRKRRADAGDAVALAHARTALVAKALDLSAETVAQLDDALKRRPDLVANQGSWSKRQQSAWRHLSGHAVLPHSVDMRQTLALASLADTIDMMNIWLWEHDLSLTFDQDLGNDRPLQTRVLQLSDGRRLCELDEKALGTKVYSKQIWQLLDKRSRSCSGEPKSELYRQMEQALCDWVRLLPSSEPAVPESATPLDCRAARPCCESSCRMCNTAMLDEGPNHGRQKAVHNLQRVGLVAGKTPAEAVMVEYSHPNFGETLGLYRRRDLIYDLEHKFLRLNESEPGESPSATTASSSHNGDNTDKRGKRCRPVQEQAEAASSDERQVQLPSSDVGPSGVMAGPSGVVAAECGMCLEPMEERWALVPCGHTQYCIRCIDTLEHEQKPLCPECRGDIKKKMRIYMYM